MIVFSMVFGRFAKIPSDGLPYPIFAYSALLPWNLFASSLSRGGESVVGSANLVSKIYFQAGRFSQWPRFWPRCWISPWRLSF